MRGAAKRKTVEIPDIIFITKYSDHIYCKQQDGIKMSITKSIIWLRSIDLIW